MRHEPALDALMKSRLPGELATVPPVVSEIEYGIQRIPLSSKKRSLLQSEMDRLLAVLKVLPWTPESSSRFGSIKAALERTGDLIDDFDIAIAAIAMSHDAGVLTANLVHFRRIRDLSCTGW